MAARFLVRSQDDQQVALSPSRQSPGVSLGSFLLQTSLSHTTWLAGEVDLHSRYFSGSFLEYLWYLPVSSLHKSRNLKVVLSEWLALKTTRKVVIHNGKIPLF